MVNNMKLKQLFVLLGFIGSTIAFGVSIWEHDINWYAMSSAILFLATFLDYLTEELLENN
jgi:hypothetical membrane protein